MCEFLITKTLMKKACIIQHEDATATKATLEWLDRNGYQTQICKIYLQQPLPELADLDLLIVCGGVMNVDQEEQFNWLKQEKKYLSEAIKLGKKVVGLCLGSQLIAEVLGAKVGPHPHLEIGWHKVNLIPDGKIVTESDAKEHVVFQWHGYSWQLPEGAKLIATNSACETQAYVYKDNVMAFQFHPETTVEWALEAAYDPALPSGKFCHTKEQMIQDTELYQKSSQDWYYKTLDRFI